MGILSSTFFRLQVLIFGLSAVGAQEFTEEGCYDVAIVGGGIGGTYTAWRLRNQGLKVAIFESTDRIGGRTFSRFLPSAPDVPVDLGAMRYIPRVHTTLERTVEALGLRTKIFQPDQFEKLFYVRRRRLHLEDFNTDKNPYNLAPWESKNPVVLKWSFAQKVLNVSEPNKIPDIEEFVTPDGVPLYKQGYLSLLGNVWSTEAKAYLVQRENFRFFFEPNINAVYHIVGSKPSTRPVARQTVVGGMNRVAITLARKFLAASTSHSIKLNRRVDKIVKSWFRGKLVYQLGVYRTKTERGYTSDRPIYPERMCAAKVILALPTSSLIKIQLQPFRDNDIVQEYLNAVTNVSVMKLFLAYPYAWWDTLPQTPAKAFETDNPLRKGGEIGRYLNSSGHETAVFMAAYTDGETNVDYWRKLRKFPPAFLFSNTPDAFSVSERVLAHAHDHLGAVYGIDPAEIPRPIDGVMTIWDKDTNSGWQSINPGYQPKAVEKFMRRPVPGDDIFVVTNSYSRKFRSWTEGSLRMADSVLSDFFGLS